MPLLLALIELWRRWRRRLRPATSRIRCGRRLTPGAHKHRHSERKPEWLKHEILRLKALMPTAGCRTIADLCNRRFAAVRKITVGKTFVYETLRQHAYDIQILRRRRNHAKPRTVPRNRIWALDLTGRTDAHGCLHQLLGVLDHCSRALLHPRALRENTSRTLLATLREVVDAYGKPRAIRTDNEAIFTSREFRNGLKQLGIRHQRTAPGCPWQNGRIERLFGTLKQKLDHWQVSGAEQLNRDLGVFRCWYNHIRPHQNLDGRRPAEAWGGNDLYAIPSQQECWFEAWDGLLTGIYLR